MNSQPDKDNMLTDMHFHVGLLGNEFPHWGRLSEWYRRQLVYKIFLLYTRLNPSEVSDREMRNAVIKTIDTSTMDHVVCLALDPIYDSEGKRREDLSHFWIDNDYILDLQKDLGKKVLLGSSVHPFDPEFENRIIKYVDKGAVLLKWIPSAQQINLADDRVRKALKFLATVRGGKALPLLLHVGMEYAIPTSNSLTRSYDFLSWTWWDKFYNFFRGRERWAVPQVRQIKSNLEAGLDAGMIIIFAHCGLPYYASNFLKRIIEHSEFKEVVKYLVNYDTETSEKGKCYADVSAFATPFRRTYFNKIKNLPESSLLYGSDFPTPVFELHNNLKEIFDDFVAVLKGHLDRLIIPEDNLLDVNYNELKHFFPGHKMFRNFNELLN